MGSARLVLKNLHQRVSSFPTIGNRTVAVPKQHQQRWCSEAIRRCSTAATENVSSAEKSDGREVAVSEGSRKKSLLFPKKQRRRGLWRNNERDLVPFDLNYLFPSGLGNALQQASENINRLFENLAPSRLLGRMKEDDKCYKLRYEVPGLSKEEIKITIEDGLLMIKGEHKEEGEEGSDDEHWSYGYYNATLLLPDDAKVDEIKAEMKDGILYITIPRTERQGKDVKEVPIH